MPGIPSTPSAYDNGPIDRSSFRRPRPSETAWDCHPRDPSTTSPVANAGDLDSTTRPTTPPVITPPTSTGAAYDLRDRILPRWYGSSDSHNALTSTSPSLGLGDRRIDDSEVRLLRIPDGP